MRSSKPVLLFINIFCLAFALWKSEVFIHTFSYLIHSLHREKLADEKIFVGFPNEVILFSKAHNLSSLCLSEGLRDDTYSLYRSTYGLWPIKILPDSKYGALLKGESTPAKYTIFQPGKEVDFVHRSP